jgi:adenosine deaminase
VSSNMALKVFPDYKAHPLRRFFDAGIKVTLGSDDPAFFNTTITREYHIAHKYFGMSQTDMIKISRNAIEAAFIDEETRGRLLEKIDAYKPRHMF